MKTEIMDLWCGYNNDTYSDVKITAFLPEKQTSDSAIVILPGGGYSARADYEGAGYAEFFCENGITSFVVDYRVAPSRFPMPLQDSRRAIKFVRYFADKYNVSKNKIAIMGSSAGGHLAALTSTYYEDIDTPIFDDIEKEDFVPNAQILCYPVIKLLGKGLGHLYSGKMLLGENQAEMGEELTPDLIATDKAPTAFIWHTGTDDCVNVINSLDYAKKLHEVGVNVELHIFPEGNHGLGLAKGEDKTSIHVSQWSQLLLKWLKYIEF